MTAEASCRVDRVDLLARVDLEQLLDSLVGTSDHRHRWHCPDRSHPDEHASVTVRVANGGVQRWRCWSGGHGGTAIDAVTAATGIDTGEAIRWLAARYANLPVTQRPAPPPVAAIGRPDPAVAAYVHRAAKLLWTPAGQPQRNWLARRGLHPEVLRANQVGADPGRRYLPRPKGLPGGWPSVVYPSMSPTGEVTYLQVRYLEVPADRSKYDNPSAHLAANPRLAWTAPVGTVRDGVLMVCEGTADALIAAQAGLRAVAVLGAAYPDRRVADGIVAGSRTVTGLRDADIIVCFDSDPAGRNGSTRLIQLLAEREMAATAVAPPDGLDLTGWAATDPNWVTAVAGRTSPAERAVAVPTPRRDLPSRSIAIEGLG